MQLKTKMCQIKCKLAEDTERLFENALALINCTFYVLFIRLFLLYTTENYSQQQCALISIVAYVFMYKL